MNLTQSIQLVGPTEKMTLYPIFANWDGIIRADVERSLFDENSNSISFSGSGTDALHGVNATCREPYFVEVKDSGGGGGNRIKLENTTAPVSSVIYWGDTFNVNFDVPQSGTIHYRQAGYGIVPADYDNNNNNNNNGSNNARNNGSSNQVLNGTYHLSFTSFYPATVNLPEQAGVMSFLEVTCQIVSDSQHVQISEFPNIYVYGVWFRIE